MRLLFVVQRYGSDVAGGAEAFCRLFAERLTARGVHVEVVTSCATSYVDWANIFAPGTHDIAGVPVHRLPVVQARDDRLFGPLNSRVMAGERPIPLYLQEEWMSLQGPRLDGFGPWLDDRAETFDAAVFFTYLYHPTWSGLHRVAGRLPTLLHPTAHDEPPLYLPIFDLVMRLPDALGYLTEEEQALVQRVFRLPQPSIVTGIGVDLDVAGDEAAFRRQFDLEDAPFLLYAGRIDPHKGAVELFDFFTTYKQRNPGPLKLVYVGEPVRPLPEHGDVVVTGFVDEKTKHDAYAACTALVQPSYFESFSMVLTEAWAHGKAALVQGRCDVLAGQAARSDGGIAFDGFAEFEGAVDLLLSTPGLSAELGASGRRYVEDRYAWDEVLTSYERFLGRLATRSNSIGSVVRS